MARERWGRWGPEDEAGAGNLVGAPQVSAAAQLVARGRVIPLGQPLRAGMPIASHRLPFRHFMDRDGGDYAAGARAPGGFAFADDTIIMPCHGGTHIDALSHVWYEESLYNGFAATTVRSTTGAARCGAEKLRPLVTRGVLLDLTDGGRTPLPAGRGISDTELAAAGARAKVTITMGDVVLVRTGWHETHAGSSDYYDGEPGIDLSGALWLAEAGVAAIGADNYAVEQLPAPAGSVFPVHQRLIRDFGVPLIEGLVLSELAGSGATSFLFVAAPLPIVGASASPLCPLAVF